MGDRGRRHTRGGDWIRGALGGQTRMGDAITARVGDGQIRDTRPAETGRRVALSISICWYVAVTLE